MPIVTSLLWKQPTTPLKLLTLMCWLDPEERGRALASFAGATIASGEEMTRAALRAAAAGKTQAIDERIPPLLDDPGRGGVHELGPTLLKQYAHETLARVEAVREGLFVPSGGLQAVLHAPRQSELIALVAKATRGGAISAALQIILVARMDKHPIPGLKASLTRARSLLEQMTWTAGVFGTERAQITAFNDWGPIAPVWAGVLVAGGYPWGEKQLVLRGENIVDAIFSVLYQPERLAQALSYGLAFAEFATSFEPVKSQQPLLSAERVVRFETDVDIAPLPLTPLSNAERNAALKARTKKLRVD